MTNGSMKKNSKTLMRAGRQCFRPGLPHLWPLHFKTTNRLLTIALSCKTILLHLLPGTATPEKLISPSILEATAIILTRPILFFGIPTKFIAQAAGDIQMETFLENRRGEWVQQPK